MKIKTDSLREAALDWAVGKCVGLSHRLHGQVYFSTDWTHGGPIITQEKIGIEHFEDGWYAAVAHKDEKFDGVMLTGAEGPTPLIAAMRCYVASQLGDEVDVPDELIEGEAA